MYLLGRKPMLDTLADIRLLLSCTQMHGCRKWMLICKYCWEWWMQPVTKLVYCRNNSGKEDVR
jgi:hypothetical protein